MLNTREFLKEVAKEVGMNDQYIRMTFFNDFKKEAQPDKKVGTSNLWKIEKKKQLVKFIKEKRK